MSGAFPRSRRGSVNGAVGITATLSLAIATAPFACGPGFLDGLNDGSGLDASSNDITVEDTAKGSDATASEDAPSSNDASEADATEGGDAPPGCPDPSWANVVLLLRMDLPSSLYSDESAARHALTPVGSAQVSAAQSKYGGASVYFDGAGSYLTTPDSPDWNLSTVDFTVETWLYSTSSSYGWVIGQWRENGGADRSFGLYVNFPAGKVSFAGVQSNVTLSSTSDVGTANAWHHVAATRQGDTWRLFVDGALEASANFAAAAFDSSEPLYIGRYSSSATPQFYTGYVDDLRITKGVARYTAPFTPPGPLPVCSDP
jgi:Concanavalin A-like lectin/glucanases superfamily